MMRPFALSVGAVAALVAGVVFAPAARAAEEKEGKTRVVIRHGGAFLGVGLAEVEGEARGAKVRSVESDSPAEKAGIKEGDVIVRFDGESVRSASQLARLVRETPAGRSVAIEVARGGAPQKLTATLAEGGAFGEGGLGSWPDLPRLAGKAWMAPLPPGEPRAHVLRRFEGRPGPDEDFLFHFSPSGPRRLGIEFTDMGEQLAEHFKVAGKAGVLVTSVAPDTAAARAGLKAGDVLLEFDGQKIERGADLQRAVARAEGGKKIAVRAQRDGRPLDLEVTLEGSAVERRRAPGVTL